MPLLFLCVYSYLQGASGPLIIFLSFCFSLSSKGIREERQRGGNRGDIDRGERTRYEINVYMK